MYAQKLDLIRDLEAKKKNRWALCGVSLKEYASSYSNFIWCTNCLYSLYQTFFIVFNINCLFLMQRCLEEVDMERYINQQINAHLSFAAMQKAMKKGEFST